MTTGQKKVWESYGLHEQFFRSWFKSLEAQSQRGRRFQSSLQDDDAMALQQKARHATQYKMYC